MNIRGTAGDTLHCSGSLPSGRRFYVTMLSTAFALVLGLPLGVLLVAGEKDGILPLPGWLMHIINVIINLLRSPSLS